MFFFCILIQYVNNGITFAFCSVQQSQNFCFIVGKMNSYTVTHAIFKEHVFFFIFIRKVENL